MKNILQSMFGFLVAKPELQTSECYHIFATHSALQKVVYAEECKKLDGVVKEFNTKVTALVNDHEYHRKVKELFKETTGKQL